jgi:hypothetical protein
MAGSLRRTTRAAISLRAEFSDRVRERGAIDVAQWRGSAKLRVDTVKVCLQPWREPTLHGTTTDTTEM